MRFSSTTLALLLFTTSVLTLPTQSTTQSLNTRSQSPASSLNSNLTKRMNAAIAANTRQYHRLEDHAKVCIDNVNEKIRTIGTGQPTPVQLVAIKLDLQKANSDVDEARHLRMQTGATDVGHQQAITYLEGLQSRIQTLATRYSISLQHSV